MKTAYFKKMLVAYAKRFNVDPKTPVLASWRDGYYHGIFMVDSDNADGQRRTLLVCHQKCVNAVYFSPVSFTINDRALRSEHVVQETKTFEELLSDSIYSNDLVEVLISTENLPKNIIIDIDPFGCKLIQGFEKPTLVLCCKVKEECGHGDPEHGWNFTVANCHSQFKEPHVKSESCCDEGDCCEYAEETRLKGS